MRLALYISRQVGLAIAGAGGVLLVLALGLDLLDTATELLDLGGFAALARYSALRLPLIAVTVLPIAVLTGGAIAFFAMAARSELVVIRASGVNTLRMMLLLAPLSGLIGLGYGYLSDALAARAEQALVRSFPELVGTPTARMVWARAPNEIVRIRSSIPSGGTLSGVSIFDLDDDGLILGRTDAEGAEFRGDGWELTGEVTVTGLGGVNGPGGNRHWITRLRPADVRTLAAKPEFVGAQRAAQVLAGIAYGARGAPFYQTRLWRGYVAIAVPAIMLLFAAAAGFGLIRSGGRGWLAAGGVATGFLFIATDGFLISLGASGAMDPMLAVLSAPVLFAGLGLWSIILLEE
ncbi:LptF/LptG family permease [Limibaculum sp. M0105]|uniref:LptF/LptG family permease n=1 Tax=Thermohalobaculum xanthum TaxID=2753746 RepID=A0A8J7SFQ7_9RHOB|nr:LptF/LptG family permease [Thermohalobaculum xanthum]MBK0400291.1 LptF/LptG family permease [Thermohalobaculum xanthum]